jgi:hypothetical protein
MMVISSLSVSVIVGDEKEEIPMIRGREVFPKPRPNRRANNI